MERVEGHTRFKLHRNLHATPDCKLDTDLQRLVKVCLQISHLERCYTGRFCNKPDNYIIALEFGKLLVKNALWPTEGQLKALNMVKEDLFNGRSMKEAKMYCTQRTTGLRSIGVSAHHAWGICRIDTKLLQKDWMKHA